jgi:alpha-glucosidase
VRRTHDNELNSTCIPAIKGKKMLKKVFALSAWLSVLAIAVPILAAQSKVDAEGHEWWQHAVFYEIYPRSFADSNNDGIGDLNGITSKLDYLRHLGVDAIWITPCFPSPQVDFGYDVSDYENIDPTYGTLADFDRLVKNGHERDIRVILDFVVNHTSDQHPWFLDSKSSKNAFHRDWYIWRDGRGPGQPPNNWLSVFGGSAWTFDATTGQYYYHFFYPQQPDLNWRNPAVENAMFDVTRWWYKRGVAGFRLDAVDTLFEDPNLRDNPILPGKNKLGDPNIENKYTTKLPEIHEALMRLRKVADESNAVLIGETWTANVDELKQYYGEHGKELQMPMDFLFTQVNRVSAPEFRRQIAAIDSSGVWPVYLLSNHDIVRSYNRYGDGKNNDAIAKVMAGLYLTLRGTPIIYYGEELGMENNDPKRKEDVKDPIGKRGWPEEKGRDGERTPMQWSDATNAGFSTVAPWLPVAANYKTHNVEAEDKDPDSILNFYRKVLELRHTDPALLEGRYVPLNKSDSNVLSYLRQYKDEAVLVVLNMSGAQQSVKFDLTREGFGDGKPTTLLTTIKPEPSGIGTIEMPPFGVYIAKLVK